MEGKDRAKEIVDLVKVLNDKISDFEKKVNKNEQLLLHVFSYLYSRQDVVHNYDSDLLIIDKNIKLLNDQVVDINNRIQEFSKIQQPPIIKEKKKRKRPWHWFITKHLKYKKLCKERELLHEQQRLELVEKLRIKEEEKIKAEEERKRKEEQERLNRIKREEQAKLEKEMRKKLARNKMNEILQIINKGEN